MAEGGYSPRELKNFFSSNAGKALLEEHGLRRSRGLFQRTVEATGISPIALHKKSGEGALDPLGEVCIHEGKLVVFHLRPTGHRERRDLAKFAKALANKFGLSVEYRQTLSHLPDTED